MNTWYGSYLLATARQNELITEARLLGAFRQATGRRSHRRLRDGPVELRRSAVIAFRPRREMIVCLSGRIWLTRSGDPEDYILGPAERMSLDGRSRVVVNALEPSVLSIRPAVSSETAPSVRQVIRTA